MEQMHPMLVTVLKNQFVLQESLNAVGMYLTILI